MLSECSLCAKSGFPGRACVLFLPSQLSAFGFCWLARWYLAKMSSFCAHTHAHERTPPPPLPPHTHQSFPNIRTPVCSLGYPCHLQDHIAAFLQFDLNGEHGVTKATAQSPSSLLRYFALGQVRTRWSNAGRYLINRKNIFDVLLLIRAKALKKKILGNLPKKSALHGEDMQSFTVDHQVHVSVWWPLAASDKILIASFVLHCTLAGSSGYASVGYYCVYCHWATGKHIFLISKKVVVRGSFGGWGGGGDSLDHSHTGKLAANRQTDICCDDFDFVRWLTPFHFPCSEPQTAEKAQSQCSKYSVHSHWCLGRVQDVERDVQLPFRVSGWSGWIWYVFTPLQLIR